MTLYRPTTTSWKGNARWLCTRALEARASSANELSTVKVTGGQVRDGGPPESSRGSSVSGDRVTGQIKPYSSNVVGIRKNYNLLTAFYRCTLDLCLWGRKKKILLLSNKALSGK